MFISRENEKCRIIRTTPDTRIIIFFLTLWVCFRKKECTRKQVKSCINGALVHFSEKRIVQIHDNMSRALIHNSKFRFMTMCHSI